jgi:hypothetical protein
MKYAILLAAGAALTLGACSKGEEPTPDASASATAEAAETAATADTAAAGTVDLAAGAAPTKEYIVGKWGEAPDCKLPMTFNADGSITDGPTDKWTLTGNKLSLGGMFNMNVTVVDADHMSTVNDGGGKTTLMRCK